jgi:hypothetical protein
LLARHARIGRRRGRLPARRCLWQPCATFLCCPFDPVPLPLTDTFSPLDPTQVASTRVSGSLQVGKVAQGKTLVAELARRFPAEERLAKLSAEIGRLSA